jgi:GTP cyclohydrolase II
VKVVERLPCEPHFAKGARAYMRTKKDKMGHILNGV